MQLMSKGISLCLMRKYLGCVGGILFCFRFTILLHQVLRLGKCAIFLGAKVKSVVKRKNYLCISGSRNSCFEAEEAFCDECSMPFYVFLVANMINYRSWEFHYCMSDIVMY